jgi:alkaline phosphatase D
MSSLRPPGLGPIVGHTTDRSCRLWIRALDPADKGPDLADDRRTIGVLTVMAEAGNDLPLDRRPVFYFRLRREYDRTGTFNLGLEKSLGDKGDPFPLTPNTEYRVRMGTLAFDDPLPNDLDLSESELADRLPPPTVWREDFDRLPREGSEAVFRTFGPESAIEPKMSFLLGSCRYPGILFKERESDQIFGPMFRDHVPKPPPGPGEPAPIQPALGPVRFVLMMGDQIYADLLNRMVPIGRADTFEEFQRRYHTAFGSMSMRRLMRHLSTYMILDDHEIEDNWTQDRVRRAPGRSLFLQAIGAYMSYQWSHGPRTYDGRLYYRFACNGYPFFVLDTRTQRFIDDIEERIDDNHLLGRPSLDPNEPGQLDRLLAWLTEQQKAGGAVPKFIVSSSVFVPNTVQSTKSEKYKLDDDAWAAFPTTRKALLDHIVAHKIQNVIFLSGDIHCANVAEMRFTGSKEAEKLKAFSVVSSAFYWPFPFADGEPSNYVHDSTDKRTKDTFALSRGHKMDYTASAFTQEDNFCRIDLDQAQATLTVRVFDWEGKPIQRPAADGSPGDLISVLRLAAW